MAKAPAKNADGFLDDWRALRADDDIQFAPIRPSEPDPPPEPPDWLRDFLEWLGDLLSPVGDALGAFARLVGMSAQVLTWGLIAIGVAIVLYLAWRLTEPYRLRRKDPAPDAPGWTPDAGEALALLDDADRLATEGRYDEATHLLLKRSVGQIAAARPDWLEPSSTARGAFATIAERVERSLFALRGLSADDWHASRAAYAEFALAAPRLA